MPRKPGRDWRYLGIPVLLVASLCLILVLRAGDEDAPAPDRGPLPPKSDAHGPKPEVVSILSDRERVLAVVRRSLVAWDRHDFEGVWELMSEPARDVWREILEADEAEQKASLLGLPMDFRAMAQAYGAQTFDDPRALFLSQAAGMVQSPSGLDRVAEEVPEVVIEADLATVTYPRADLRIHLGRDHADWRVHLCGPAAGAFELLKTPSGRAIPVVSIFDLVLKKDPDRERWLQRAPRLGGVSPAEERPERAYPNLALYADAFNGVRFRGREIGLEEMGDMLFNHAERKRDLTHPNKPSYAEVLLYLDRDQRMTDLRNLLLMITHPEIRICPLFLPARVGGETGEFYSEEAGLKLWLTTFYLTTMRIRVGEPETELVLREVEEAAFGVRLGEAVRALPEGKRFVRLRCGPHVSAERFLRVLHALAQEENLRVVLDLREKEVPETTWGLELDGKPVRIEELTGPVMSVLDLQIFR